MQLGTHYPKHDQGDRTRQQILKTIKEDPTITLLTLSQKLGVSPITIQRQKLNLRIAGLLLGLTLFLIFIPLSAIASGVKDGRPVAVAVEVDAVEIEEVEEEAIEDDGDTAEIEA